MTITIQLDAELYDHFRTPVHDELNEKKNRQKIEQRAMKIRTRLDQLSGPKMGPPLAQKPIWGLF